MPVPTPAGALSAAFRVLCMRCLRAKPRGVDDHVCNWSPTSSKCDYCTGQHAECVPLPWYLGPEYQALVDAEASASPDPAAIKAAAAEAGQVATLSAQSLPKFRSPVEFALYEQGRATHAALKEYLAALEECFATLKEGFAGIQDIQSSLLRLQTEQERISALFAGVVDGVGDVAVAVGKLSAVVAATPSGGDGEQLAHVRCKLEK